MLIALRITLNLLVGRLKTTLPFCELGVNSVKKYIAMVYFVAQAPRNDGV